MSTLSQMKPIAPEEVERWLVSSGIAPRDAYRTVVNLSSVGRVCPVCEGSLRVPFSITDDPLTATRWRRCHFCVALIHGQLQTSGVVHARKVESEWHTLRRMRPSIYERAELEVAGPTGEAERVTGFCIDAGYVTFVLDRDGSPVYNENIVRWRSLNVG